MVMRTWPQPLNPNTCRQQHTVAVELLAAQQALAEIAAMAPLLHQATGQVRLQESCP